MELSKTTQVDKNFISAVILAAGGSSRMGTDKITAELCGVPVIAYSIKAMAESNANEIIVVASVSNVDRIKEIAKSVNSAKPVKIILGGKTRAESAVNAFTV